MPRAQKRLRPHELETSEALGTSQHKASLGNQIRREDSSEAASAVTLTPALLLRKGTQEGSNTAILGSQSAASSHGGDTPPHSTLTREIEYQGPTHPSALLIDITKQAGWSSVSRDIDHSLASLLRSKDSDTIRYAQKVECSLPGTSEGGYYMQFAETEELQPVTYETDYSESAATSEAVSRDSFSKALASVSGTQFGCFWQKALQPQLARHTKDTPTVRQIVTLLGVLLPEHLPPVVEGSQSASWLSFSSAGRAATDLKLQVGSALWTSGFTKTAPALRPVYLSVPQGSLVREVLRQDNGEAAHRKWVVQADQEALSGAEMVLKALRLDASSSGQPLQAVGPSWEELDSRAAVVSSENELGSAAEIKQTPGQLLALQQQGHCSVASGGLFLSWNVAFGPDWPQQAVQDEQTRSTAVRRAAVSARNAWLASESGHVPPLHVLRLLFSVACSVDEAHSSLVEGLQRTFVPLCAADIRTQSQCPLPQLNAKKGLLESKNHADLRCSCCGGGFLFSFVSLIKRKGDRGGSLCWLCWSQRESLGLSKDCRNARKCIVLQQSDLHRLIGAVGAHRAVKRQKSSA